MNPLRKFEEYITKGIVKKQMPDKFRANFLITNSEKEYCSLTKFIGAFGIQSEDANHIVKNSYDIIMELIRAKMLMAGFSSVGVGAHEAEVSYLQELNFLDSEIDFVNQLRFFRNGVTYYGKILDKEYANRVVDFLNKIYPKLMKIVNTKL